MSPESHSREHDPRDTILSIIAHDLRAPIAQLNALVFLLREAPERITREKMQVYAEDLEKATRHLSATLENVLHWSAARRRSFEPEMAAHPLGGLIEGAVELYRPVAAEKGVNLKFAGGEAVSVVTDGDVVALLVRNLVANAIKFTPEKGRVRVGWRLAGEQACIEISDTGVGMSEETLREIRAGGHLHSTRGTRGERGTGLGLALCQEFAERIGAELEFESGDGEGTTARVRLPLRT